MTWARLLWNKLRVLLFGRSRFDREFKEEMQFHMALKAEEHRENGMSPPDAHAAVGRQFGDTLRLREAGWDAWGWAPLERILQDVRFALRTLRCCPGFSLSVILLLGVALWMNTTVFSVIHAVMLARSFASYQTLNLGFQTDRILGVNLLWQFPREGKITDAQFQHYPFYQELFSRLSHTPGIDAAAMGSIPPKSMSTSSYGPEGKEQLACVMDFVSARYFHVPGRNCSFAAGSAGRLPHPRTQSCKHGCGENAAAGLKSIFSLLSAL
jgi:hypothetical protein